MNYENWVKNPKPNNIWGGGACIKTRNGLWKLNEMEWTKQALRHCTLAFWTLSKIIEQVEVPVEKKVVPRKDEKNRG